MVTVFVLGLDQYVVGHYSKEHSGNLANLMEIDPEELNFFAPYAVIFHNGIEQTSWHTEVIVRAPKRLKVLEEKVAKYLLNTLNEVSIHVEVSFEYFEEEKRYCVHKDPYPRYIEEEELVDVEGDAGDDQDEDDEEPNPADHAELDINNPNELYLGDVFSSHKEEMEHLSQKDSCDGHDCHCHKHH